MTAQGDYQVFALQLPLAFNLNRAGPVVSQFPQCFDPGGTLDRWMVGAPAFNLDRQLIRVEQLLLSSCQGHALAFKGEFLIFKFGLDGAGVHTGSTLDTEIVCQN